MSIAASRERPAVAAAPCSFGMFTSDDVGPDPERFCAEIAAGYEGTDLGPVGYLGRGATLRDRLARHGLGLAGGWIQIAVGDDDLTAVDAALDVFAEAPNPDDLPPPRPTLAVDGPGSPRTGHAPSLDDGGWERLIARVRSAVDRCRGRGFEPVFHHHVGTWVESPSQIDRLLDATDVDLCFDTGHLVLGGGAIDEGIRRWGERITHLHMKDVRLDLAAELREAEAPLEEVWRRDVFCELGTGQVDVDAALSLAPPDGWVVVEQDRLFRDDVDEIASAQRRNRDYLAERGW